MTSTIDGDARHALASATVAPTLGVIVPTRHEVGNIEPLVERLHTALGNIATELLFVDDSDDATPFTIEAVAREWSTSTFDINLLHRTRNERTGGLGGAVVAGLRALRAPWACVMDGDLQHPPELVPVLLERAVTEGSGLVVASRYREGGGADGLGSPARSVGSRGAAFVAKAALGAPLRGITDPMSGFFLVRRDQLDLDGLQPDGFKILMEIAAQTPDLSVSEVGFRFADRATGESKAGVDEAVRYLRHVRDLRGRAARRRRAAKRQAAAHQYDIHGILTVSSEGRLPELEAFRVGSLEGPADITVHIGALPDQAPPAVDGNGIRHLRYQESVGNLGFAADISIGERIELTAAPLLRHSPHVLYTNLVEPILRWRLVAEGYALVHAACVVIDEQAFFITARTDTGKTTTMLKLLDNNPYSFVADDLTIMQPDGSILPYPKPLTISKHTVHAVRRARLNWRERSTLGLQSRLHSKSGRQFAFLLTRTGLPVATVNTVVQLLVPPPKYPVQRLVPHVEQAKGGTVTGMFIIQRGDHESVETLNDDDALEILLRNCEDAYGFPPYHKLETFLLESTGDDLREVERQIIGGGLEACPAMLLTSSHLGWAEDIPGLIDDIDRGELAGATAPPKPGISDAVGGAASPSPAASSTAPPNGGPGVNGTTPRVTATEHGA